MLCLASVNSILRISAVFAICACASGTTFELGGTLTRDGQGGITGIGYLGNGNFLITRQGGPLNGQPVAFTTTFSGPQPQFGNYNFPNSNTSSVQSDGPVIMDEHQIATSPGLGGFAKGDVYIGEANTILHFNSSGQLLEKFTLTGNGPAGMGESVRGITFDTQGTFGFHLLVSTNYGRIYSIASDGSGESGAIASLPTPNSGYTPQPPGDIEAIGIAPSGFGPYGGQLIVAFHNPGSGPTFFAVNSQGQFAALSINVHDVESMVFVPSHINDNGLNGLYASFFPLEVVKTPASRFLGMEGDALVVSEGNQPQVTRVHWNPNTLSFESTPLFLFPLTLFVQSEQCPDCPSLGEEAVFVNDVPETATAGLCALGLGLMVLARKRNGRHKTTKRILDL